MGRRTKSKDHKKAEEVLMWATAGLHENLTNIIINMQNHPRPYYMLIHVKDCYDGVPAGLVGKLRNDLLGTKYTPTPSEMRAGVRTMDLSNQRTASNLIVLSDNPPIVPLISTSLLRVDNKQGRVNWIYILPPDKPIIYGADMGEASEFVFKSAANSNAPIVN